MTYGETFTVDSDLIEGGDITVTSSNPSVATVSGLVITPVAVGTTTITVSTAANENYRAGSETFTLTVTAPQAKNTAAVAETVFEETFAESTGSITSFSGNDGNGTLSADNTGWSFSNGYGAGESAKFGTKNNNGQATTPDITVVPGQTYTLTFKAAPWSSDNSTMSVSVTGGTISGVSTNNMNTGEWNDYTATVTATSESLSITFAASNNRFFLDEVKLSSNAATLTATLNAYGYTTICSEYPLDFSSAEGYSAWQITDISSDNVVTFEKVTGSVKGGIGLLLMGTAGATVELSSVASTNALDDNLFEGTLAPTYVAAGQYFGLSGNTFKRINAGTIPAGKAVIDANWYNETSAKQFSFNFVENDPTGIKTIDSRSPFSNPTTLYDLQGRRVENPQRGIYIVNGKKVVIK